MLWWCWFSHQVVSNSCDPMDCSLPGSSVHGFSRQEYWSGLPFPSPNACCRISQCSRTGTNSTYEKGLKKKKKERKPVSLVKVHFESSQIAVSSPQPQQKAGSRFLEEQSRVCLETGQLGVWRGEGCTAEGSCGP